MSTIANRQGFSATYAYFMESCTGVRIISVERVNGGLLIRFEDGLCAFYSADLLRATAPAAEAVNEESTVW